MPKSGTPLDFGLYPTDMEIFQLGSTNINNDLHRLMLNVSKMYALTGDDHFKKQLDDLKQYVSQLPEETCSAWGVNKKQFEIQPTPIPEHPMYGLLHRMELSTKPTSTSNEVSEAFAPEYTLKLFKDLDQAKRTEIASIVQCRNSVGKGILTQEVYHPKLYQIKFEPI